MDEQKIKELLKEHLHIEIHGSSVTCGFRIKLLWDDKVITEDYDSAN